METEREYANRVVSQWEENLIPEYRAKVVDAFTYIAQLENGVEGVEDVEGESPAMYASDWFSNWGDSTNIEILASFVETMVVTDSTTTEILQGVMNAYAGDPDDFFELEFDEDIANLTEVVENMRARVSYGIMSIFDVRGTLLEWDDVLLDEDRDIVWDLRYTG